MSRGTAGRRRARRASQSPPRPARRRHAGRIAAVLAVVLLAVLAGWWLLHRGGTRLPTGRGGTASPALLDSLRSVQSGHDWQRATVWFQRAVDVEPRNPLFLLGLGLARHNLLWAGADRDSGRSSSRTSLVRVTSDLQVLALLDSALANAHDDAEWARIHRWSGQIYESMDLPLDGLQLYLETLDRQPGFEPARDRAASLLKMLRDPQARPPGAPTASLKDEGAKPDELVPTGRAPGP